MTKRVVADCPHVGEFSYVKMLVTQLVRSLNVYLESKGDLPVAVGAVQNEYNNILTAREVFQNPDATMLEFVHAYNSLNDFNLIGHTVGNHRDHFPGGEGFENKLLVVHPTLKGPGRGGALFEDQYCWALLDWIRNTNCIFR